MPTGSFYPVVDADDGYSEGGVLHNDYSDISFGTGPRDVFIRFPNVTIPAGSTIVSAVLTFTGYMYGSTYNASDTANVKISFQDADNPDAPTTWAEQNGAAKTSWVDWNSVEHWANDTEYASPSLISILQAIIDRLGWVSGNAVVAFAHDNGSSGACYRIAHIYSGLKITLDVEWTEGGITETVEETIDFADEIILFPLHEVIEDSLVITESVPLPIDPSLNEDTIGFSDYTSGGFQFNDVLEEVLELYDWTDLVPRIVVTNIDEITFTDETLYSLSQSLILSDELFIEGTPKVGWNKSIADAITLVDTILVKHGITIQDWLLLNESIIENWRGTETVQDLFNVDEFINATRTVALSIADSLTVADAVPIILAIKVLEYIFLSDAIPLTNMFTVLDGLSLSDEAQRSWDKVIVDALAVDDASILTFLSAILNISDSITVTDAVVGSLTISIIAADTINAADVVASKANLFSLILDSLSFDVSLSLDGEVWQCWVISNIDFDPSVFSGFNFNSYCSFQNKSYGMKTDGLYILEGTTDEGAPIHSGVILATTNFSTENRKKFRRAGLGISGSTAAIRVQTDEGGDRIFRVSDRRAYIDRDMAGKDFVFSISDFDSLDFVELVPMILAR